jgi:CBS domain-containing protein
VKRWLYHQETVLGPYPQLDRTLRRRVRDLVAEVTDAEQPEATPEGDLLVHLPAQVLGRDLRKQVRLHTGVAEQRGSRTCIPLRWRAEPGGALFPAFDGTIELEPLATNRTSLAIVGAATLPLGFVGGAVDAAALGSVADQTVRHLVVQLARTLAARWAEPAPPPTEPSSPVVALAVRDVMTPDPLLLHADMPLRTAALLLFHYGVSGAPVTDDAGGLIGVLSEADLLDVEAPPRHGFGRDVEAARRRRAATTVGDACSHPAREVAATAPLAEAAAMMRDHDIARLVVVDGSSVVGIVSRHDVLRALIRSDTDVQASVDRVLAQDDEAGVMAAVEWGVVRLEGGVAARSSIARLVRAVRDVDGVIGVEHGGLTWEYDDIVPPPVPMM